VENIRCAAKARMRPWELKDLIMQLFSMSSQRFLNKNVLTIVSVEYSKKKSSEIADKFL
jgi:hypothetical protein